MLNFDLSTPDVAALVKQRFQTEGAVALANLTTAVLETSLHRLLSQWSGITSWALDDPGRERTPPRKPPQTAPPARNTPKKRPRAPAPTHESTAEAWWGAPISSSIHSTICARQDGHPGATPGEALQSTPPRAAERT